MPSQATAKKFRWILIKPGTIDLDGYPVQISLTGQRYTLLHGGEKLSYITLASAKLGGEAYIRELIEIGVYETAQEAEIDRARDKWLFDKYDRDYL